MLKTPKCCGSSLHQKTLYFFTKSLRAKLYEGCPDPLNTPSPLIERRIYLISFLSFRPSSSSVHKQGVQETSTTSTVPLPDVNGTKTDRQSANNSTRPATSAVKHTETIPSDNTLNVNDKSSRRYLSHSWRVLNPREDIEQNVRPEHNASSFFKYTKKAYPENFFIHPDWY
jgi:hypothetical protein